MKSSNFLEIESVIPLSNADKAGFKNGDLLLSIDGNTVSDIIDMLFYGSDNPKTAIIKRGEQKYEIDLSILYSSERSSLSKDIVFKHFKVKTCNNRCIFCFVSQLPKGLRKELYIRDEDYRMSFLYGNFITLTNLTIADKERIKRQNISPLYISVHSTDDDKRRILLGNKEAVPVLDEIKWLARNRIRMHCQVVLCPGINDGINLEKTIKELYRYYPYVMSIAVVPVGITRYQKKKIKTVDKSTAIDTLKIIERFQNRFRRKHGESIVYAADELYLKADRLIPPIENYDELPQFENGVGMIALFKEKTKQLKLKKLFSEDALKSKSKFITVSGFSFFPFLNDFIRQIQGCGIDINAYEVINSFFGETVTVTGLLTGRDIIKSLYDKVTEDMILIIPDVCLKEGDNLFLDNVSLSDIEELLHIKTLVVESTPLGLIDGINRAHLNI